MGNLRQNRSVTFLLQDPGRLWGAEKVTLELLAGLRAASCPVEVVCIQESRLRIKQSPLLAALEERHIPIVSVDSSGPVSGKLLCSLQNCLRNPDTAVVHAIGAKAVVYGYFALRSSSVKLVSTLHGWLHRADPKERLYEFLEKMVLRRYDRVIVLSRYYYEWMRRIGIRPDHLDWIPTGMDMGHIVGRRDAEMSLEKIGNFRVGMLGRLSEEKNHAMLIRAARKFLDTGLDARFIIAGEGPLREKITRMIRRKGLRDHMEVQGYKEPSQFMNDINCLAVCSRIENLPLNILEAMCWSRPVVATRVGGIPDLVRSGESGFLVAPEAAEEMASRWGELSGDRSLICRMGSCGRTLVESGFSQAACISSHKALYKQLGVNACD